MGKNVLVSSRVDEQVLFTFLGVGLLSIIILGFRYTTRPTCMPITIQIGSDTIQGHVVRFNAQAEGGKSFTWDFGDNENTDEQSASAKHIFKNPGKYTVSVLVNETCTESRDIFVRLPEPGSNANLQPKIVVAVDSAVLGEKIFFTDSNSLSVSWDWDFGEPGAAGSTLRNPYHIFTTTGQKTVVLRVNGKADLVDTKFVYVTEKEKKVDIAKPKQDVVRRPQNLDIPKDPVTQPLPQPQQDVPVKKEPDPPPVTKIPDLPTHDIEDILKKVPDGGDWKEPLSKYLCGGDLNLPVIYNSKKTTLSEFCEELKKMKTKKIKKINVISSVSKQTNCITQLNITIDKKNIFERVF